MTEKRLGAPKKILIVRLKSLGDILNCIPGMRSIAKGYPEATVDVLLEDRFASLLQKMPWVHRVIEIEPKPKNRFLYDLQFIRMIRREKYDAVIDLHNGPRSALMTRLSGAPIRAGWGFGKRKGAYTLRVPSPGQDLHTIENRLFFADHLGGAKTSPRRRIHIGRESYRLWGKRMKEWGQPVNSTIIALHPGASRSDKLWPPEKFAEALSLLLKKNGRCAVVTCGPGEEEAARAIIQKEPRAFYAPPGSIEDLAALLDIAALFIGVDSGPMHIAAALETPLIALFGSSNPVFHGPYADSATVIHPESGSLSDVQPREVAESAEKFLKRYETHLERKTKR